jgi:hypothetical protein
MRLVFVIGKSVHLNYMWLPTWLGQNSRFKKEIESDLEAKIKGKELTELNLDVINDMVITYICMKFPIPGLLEYLDGLKFVQEQS